MHGSSRLWKLEEIVKTLLSLFVLGYVIVFFSTLFKGGCKSSKTENELTKERYVQMCSSEIVHRLGFLCEGYYKRCFELVVYFHDEQYMRTIYISAYMLLLTIIYYYQGSC